MGLICFPVRSWSVGGGRSEGMPLGLGQTAKYYIASFELMCNYNYKSMEHTS